MAEMMKRLASRLGVSSGEVGPQLLVSLLQGEQDHIVTQMAAAAACNWSIDNRHAQDELVGTGAIHPLIRLIAAGPDAPITMTAMQALLALTCNNSRAQDQVVDMGGIPPLLRLLGSDTPLVTGPGLVDLTTAVLAYLTAGSSENVAVIIEAGGIKVLVGLLEGGRCRGVVAEVVASMLRNVARHGPDACACIRASGALPLLVLLVRGVLGPDAVASALQALMVVSEEDKASCSLIQEAGGIQVLLEVIRTASPGSQAAEVAACTLWNMIMGSVAMQQVFRELGGVGVLVGVLVRHQEDLGLAVISAGMLGDLADGSRGAREVIREEGGVAALVELLRHEPGEQAAEACCSALANLAVFSPPNQEAIRMQGGVQAVVSVLQTCNDLSSSVAEEASRALGNLARSEANRNLILESNGIRALVGVLWAGPGTSSAHEALVALGNLAYDSLENQKAIAAAGGVWAVLSLMAAAPPGCETIEPAACVLACLMACQAAVDKLCQESHAPVLASILRSHHGSSSVIGEALLNIVATAAILPAMSAPLVKAGIFCDLVLVLGCCADMLESAAPQQELVAIAVEGLVSGSPENRIAARDQGIIPPLVHLVSSAAPSLSSTSDFASSLISKVECKVGRSGPEKGSCQKLVMELLVQLMETGTNAMVHQAAADALKLFEEPCKDRGSLPDTAKATQSAGDQKLLTARDSMVEVSVFPSGCVAGRPPPHPRTHLTKHSGLSGLNVSEWALPVAHETWDEEDDTSSATVKGVGIDPLKSEQIDALYSQTFAAAILPPGCCVAAVRALASLASGDEESQKAVWAAGGTQLLEALLSLGALEKRRCSEDATRLLQAVVSAPQNRDGILQSGGTDLLVKLLRLGPRKELTYVVARVVSQILGDHQPALAKARDLGAVEMLTNLLSWEPGMSTTAAAGVRSAIVALYHLCKTSRDSQRVFRKAGGFQALVKLLQDCVTSSPEDGAWAARVFISVCRDNKINREAFRAMQGFRPLVLLLQQTLPEQGILWVLEALAVAAEGHSKNKEAFRQASGMEVLSLSVSQYMAAGAGHGSSAISVALMQTLSAVVADCPGNQDMAREFGTIPVMVRLLAAGNNPLLISQVAETLKVMARNHEKNKTAILKAGGTKALVQLLTLNMETELDLITSAAWAVNNLAHKSEENVDLIIRSGGVQLLLRIVGHAEVRSQASIAASRALFILAAAREEASALLRQEDAVGPCTMLLTAGPHAETSLWACTLLGLLADRDQTVQAGIASAGGLELLLELASKSHEWQDVAIAAVRTLAISVVDNPRNQDKAVSVGAVKVLIDILATSSTRSELAAAAIQATPTNGGLQHDTLTSKLLSVSSLRTKSSLNTQLQTRLDISASDQPAPSKEARDALSVEMVEMVLIALGNLGSGSLSNRKAIRRAGGMHVLQKLMEAEPDGSSLHQLAQWGHDILSTNSRGSARPARCSNQMGPLITV